MGFEPWTSRFASPAVGNQLRQITDNFIKFFRSYHRNSEVFRKVKLSPSLELNPGLLGGSPLCLPLDQLITYEQGQFSYDMNLKNPSPIILSLNRYAWNLANCEQKLRSTLWENSRLKKSFSGIKFLFWAEMAVFFLISMLNTASLVTISRLAFGSHGKTHSRSSIQHLEEKK